jgi:hypothetical protein
VDQEFKASHEYIVRSCPPQKKKKNPCHLTLDKLCNLTEPQFSRQQNRVNNVHPVKLERKWNLRMHEKL